MSLILAPNKVQTPEEYQRSSWSLSLSVQKAIQELEQAKWDMAADMSIEGCNRETINRGLRGNFLYGMGGEKLGYIKKTLRGQGYPCRKVKVKKGHHAKSKVAKNQ